MTSPQQTTKPTIDQIPSDPAALASMSPEERSAAYLNSIRKSMSFFVFLALIAIVLGVVAVFKG